MDIWSAGCIFAEMLEGRPLFPGKDRTPRSLSLPPSCVQPADLSPPTDVNQFSIITELLGTPPEDVIQTICSENVSRVALSASRQRAQADAAPPHPTQTLRFVQSLPKRERIPFAQKFRGADPLGAFPPPPLPPPTGKDIPLPSRAARAASDAR